MNDTFTSRMFSSSLVQYSSRRDTFGTNRRLPWEYAPRSEIFLVWAEERYPKVRFAVEDAADHLVAGIGEKASGRVPDVAGPEVLTLGEMARSWSRIGGKRRWIVRLPLPGELARGFREGRATAPNRAVGTEPWREWLGRTYGS